MMGKGLIVKCHLAILSPEESPLGLSSQQNIVFTAEIHFR